MSDRQRVILRLVRDSRWWGHRLDETGDGTEREYSRGRVEALWCAADELAAEWFGRPLDKTHCPDSLL